MRRGAPLLCLVKVILGAGASVTSTATTPLSGLKLGDTVVVQGTKAADGSVTATSVTATGAGVKSTASRVGGFAGTTGAAGVR